MPSLACHKLLSKTNSKYYKLSTLTNAVESQIEVRKKQVEDWIVKCEGVESGRARHSRALGTNAKVAGSPDDPKAKKVLPRRYGSVTAYQEKLRQIYDTKLKQLTTLTNCLNALARSLGSHFFQSHILTPALAPPEEAGGTAALRDATPERFSRLKKELVRGKGEVSKRLNQLGEVFNKIDCLYTKLGIDPHAPANAPSAIPSSSTLAVPTYSLPRSSPAGGTRLIATQIHSVRITNRLPPEPADVPSFATTRAARLRHHLPISLYLSLELVNISILR